MTHTMNLAPPMDMNLVPMVIEQTGRGERSFDIFLAAVKRAHYFSERAGRRCDGLTRMRTITVSGI